MRQEKRGKWEKQEEKVEVGKAREVGEARKTEREVGETFLEP
jgi:hypothetical protein